MNDSEEYSPSQRRKIRHMKIVAFIAVALALVGVVYVLLPVGPYALALVVFALLVMVFFSGSSKLLNRFTSSEPRGSGGESADE